MLKFRKDWPNSFNLLNEIANGKVWFVSSKHQVAVGNTLFFIQHFESLYKFTETEKETIKLQLEETKQKLLDTEHSLNKLLKYEKFYADDSLVMKSSLNKAAEENKTLKNEISELNRSIENLQSLLADSGEKLKQQEKLVNAYTKLKNLCSDFTTELGNHI